MISKYGVNFTKEEKEAMKEVADCEVNDEQLDQASGGCGGNCAHSKCNCVGCI